MKDKIKKLKQAVIAYKAAGEYDRCPEPDKAESVAELFGYEISEVNAALTEYGGNRPDTIADDICILIEELP